jgi:hypothetical protein
MKSRANNLWIACSLVATLSAVGCVASNPGTDGSNDTGTGTGGTGADGSTPDSGTGTDISLDGDGSSGTPSDNRDLPVRNKKCDANGQNCTCLQLAVFGDFKSGAKNASVQPFLDWLNGNADGTATLTSVPTKPTLTADYLNQFDIILVANVNAWPAFGADEKAAVENWVKVQGGGIIAITGFESTDPEAVNSSQLISFAGMSFVKPWTADDSSGAAQSAPVYYQGGTTNLKSCLHWSQADAEGNPQITAPVKFIPQQAPLDKLTANLDYVGAYYGWTVQAPAGATVVANDPIGTNTPIAAAYEVEGKGRIFAYGDEWVAFANQWAPSAGSTPDNQNKDVSNICYMPATADQPERFQSVQTLYQTKQFWYNAISWVAPPNTCNFTVKDPDVVK